MRVRWFLKEAIPYMFLGVLIINILYAVGFIRTLLIIALIYFGLRFIKRYVMPMLIDKGIKNMQEKMQQQQRQQQPRRPEGEVTIEKDQQQTHSASQNKGDYVDFEEVD